MNGRIQKKVNIMEHVIYVVNIFHGIDLYINTCIRKILQFSVEKCCNEERFSIQ